MGTFLTDSQSPAVSSLCLNDHPSVSDMLENICGLAMIFEFFSVTNVRIKTRIKWLLDQRRIEVDGNSAIKAGTDVTEILTYRGSGGAQIRSQASSMSSQIHRKCQKGLRGNCSAPCEVSRRNYLGERACANCLKSLEAQ